VERNTLLWSLVLFFGASIVFAEIRRATGGQGLGLTIGLEVAALAVMVVAIVLVVRRRR
jgi:hypothetical protein